MEKAALLRLKQFLEDNFDFYGLKKAGFFGKDIKKRDYEKQAERICTFFGYKTIYEYGPVCRGIKCDGKCSPSTTIQYCKSYSVTKGWKPVEAPDQSELVSQEKYLN